MSSANVTIKMAQSASALGAGLLGFAIGGKWGYVINIQYWLLHFQ